ncbi:dihydrodipicolinate synthase family protein [Nocardia abscessus]|uniref:dihydrodipicolinate synthase family protein n=1 Tax=Nocardia abscessus TaxID=120957 RepID=UPI002455450F|nr:dihydrodipicolinate synthase family protein [Nocardia abscessus]
MSRASAVHGVSGIVAQLVTPFTADATVDTSLMRSLIDRMITAGVHAIELLGTTSESAYLEPAEWQQIAATCTEHVAGRVPLVLDVSGATTAVTVERVHFAEQLGVTAILVNPMPFWRLSESELLQHFATVADAAAVPVMVGNDPIATGIDLPPDFLLDLVFEVGNITMIKEAGSSHQRMHQFAELAGSAFSLFSGNDMQLLHGYHAGAIGWCTAAPSLVPEPAIRLWQLLKSHSLYAAANLFYRLIPLFATIAGHSQPAAIKSGLRTLGIEAGDPRLPQQPLDEISSTELAELITGIRSR